MHTIDATFGHHTIPLGGVAVHADAVVPAISAAHTSGIEMTARHIFWAASAFANHAGAAEPAYAFHAVAVVAPAAHAWASAYRVARHAVAGTAGVPISSPHGA